MNLETIIFSIGCNDLLHEVEKEFIKTRNNLIIGNVNTQKFLDGEVSVNFLTSIRGKRVYIICSPNSSDKILQLNLAIDAAKRASAKEIIPIIPYFPYSRSDKKDQFRGPIGAKVLAEMVENRGATSVITFDLHAEQIQGFFNIPVLHMEGKYVFDRYIYELTKTNDLVLAAPDAGAAKRVQAFRDLLKKRWDIELPIIHINKTRKEANKVDEMVVIGNVDGKDVLIIDDMCDTGGTIVRASEELMNLNAKSVKTVITHGIFSGDALNKLSSKHIKQVICSDSLPKIQLINKEDLEGYSKIEYITIARQIFIAMRAIDDNISIEDLKNKY